jgi:sec-independent protein translocase protein TatB|tara:strand:- start:4416 stop:4661 length:246 start_codon:yes stop_codon:yes gene_type:complete
LFQIGFLEILIIFLIGIIIIGPKRLPELFKNILKLYKKLETKFSNFKKDIEDDIGTDEIKKDVFNELRMDELEQDKTSNND